MKIAKLLLIKEKSALLLIMLFFSYFFTKIILTGTDKQLVALLIGLIIFSLFFISNWIWRISLIMASISFPVTLSFMGRDAISTGTLSVFCIFIICIFYYFKRPILKGEHNKLSIILFFLFVISIIGTMSGIPKHYLGAGIRSLLNFMSSVLLFMVIINLPKIDPKHINIPNYIERLITIIIMLVSFQIVVAILIYFQPNFGNLLRVFLHRDQNVLSLKIENYYVVRGVSIILNPESMAELLAVLFPVLWYKLNNSKKIYKNIYLIVLVLFITGLLLANTRSGYLLSLLNSFAFFFMNRKRLEFSNIFLATIIVILSLYLVASFTPEIIDSVKFRANLTFAKLEAQQSIKNIINRKKAWDEAFYVTLETISLFGNGPVQAMQLGKASINFHCLYLTLLFQFGVIGFSIYLYFFFILTKNLWLALRDKARIKNYILSSACLISFFTFIVNELKFEFNRGDSYQQVIWFIFAIYYLAAEAKQIKRSI